LVTHASVLSTIPCMYRNPRCVLRYRCCATPWKAVLQVDVPEVRQLAHHLTNRLTAVTGWCDLGEYKLALASLSPCGELLTQIYRVLQDVVPPPS
jgi:hypothetical protein